MLADTIYVSQPTVCRVIEHVTRALCAHAEDFINPSTPEELADDKRTLYGTAGKMTSESNIFFNQCSIYLKLNHMGKNMVHR